MIEILTFNYNENFKHAHTQKVKTVKETLRKHLKYNKCLF